MFRAMTLAALCTAVFVCDAQAQSVVTFERAVRNCRLISNHDARLACYDGVIDDSMPAPAPISAAPVAAPAPAAAAARTSTPVSAPQAPATPIATAAPAAPPTLGKNETIVTVASASMTPFKMLRVVTSDGTVWEQSDAATIDHVPDAGAEMLIMSGSFGRHTCKIADLDSFYCKQPK